MESPWSRSSGPERILSVYNTVKRSVHDALPMTILLGGSGLALIALGTWLGRPKGDTAKSS